ncbi:hypothetical protein D3C81_1060010 [compost metagenome]
MIHHLQQQVEDFRMRLLDFIEQQHAMRLLGDCLGQQTALIEPDITWRGTDQTRNRVPLHVLRHVEAHQLDPQRLGQLPRRLGLADTGRAGKQERTHRLVRGLEASTGQLDRRGQRVDGRVLAEYRELEVTLQITQQLLVGTADVFRRNTRDLGDNILDLWHIDALDPVRLRLQALIGARLVDHVDGLVRHMPVVDVARGQLSSGAQGFVAVLDVVMALETPLQPAQDTHGVFHRRLADIDLLETSRQGAVFLEDATEFLEGGRADAANVTRRQQRLEQVGRIHHPTRGRTGTDDGVDLVDEQDRLRTLAQLAKQRLEALLEITAVLGTGQQCTQVEGIHHTLRQQVWHLTIDDTLGQAFGNGGLADTGLTHQQRVVLAASREDLSDTLDLLLTPDQRVDAPGTRQFVQVAGISVQRIAGGRRFTAFFILHVLVTFGVGAVTRHLGDTMGDVVDHIDPGHALLLEQEHGLTFLFAEDRHQHVGASHFALAGALHMEHGTLQHTLEAQGRLGFAILVVDGNQGSGGIDELLQVVLEFVEIGATGAQNGRGSLIVKECQQQMFDGHELMTLRTSLLEGKIEGDFELAV